MRNELGVSAPCPIVVMAKAPVPGYAKTRLMPSLGAAGAAALAEKLLRHAVAQALAAKLGPVHLCCAPDATHNVFVELTSAAHTAPRLRLSVQASGDIGQRMAAAFEQAFAGVEKPARVLLMGTDLPALNAAYLRAAAAALLTHPAVLGPAADGGYGLIGLTQPEPALFSGMRWSTDQVSSHTRERLRQRGMAWLELPVLHDIDGSADLAHLPAGWL